MCQQLKAPFPYFGGKRDVAALVWERLGDCDNYVEPFAGSLAVLLLRPTPPRIETVNDLDSMVSNFWRATQHDPEAVAAHADGPVNEADLHARHRWLVLSDDAAAFRKRMRTDPDYFDARVAGWWCWGLCAWIGAGWCVEPGGNTNGPAGGSGKRRTRLAGAYGHAGFGVNADTIAPAAAAPGADPPTLSEQRPTIGDSRTSRFLRGVHGSHESLPQGRPQFADARDVGRGVNASAPEGFHEKRPFLAGTNHPCNSLGNGVHANFAAGTCAARRAWLVDWFSRLRDRLRLVRVCCGHFMRVMSSESVTTRLGVTGIFADPPYPTHRKDGRQSRSNKLYAQDGRKAADDIRDELLAWCRQHGDNPLMRICVACYEGDGYEELLAKGWTVEAWQTAGGYGNRSATGKENARRERLFFSPHCAGREKTLFDGLESDRDGA